MTAQTSAAVTPLRLPGALIDAFAELVSCPDTPAQRAQAVSWVLDQVVEAITWRHGAELQPWEADSLARVTWAAAEHAQQMARTGSAA